MWRSCFRGRHKFFFWLLLQDRLNTGDLLQRKNMDLQDYNCVLCTQGKLETLEHLFFECAFSKWCWRLVGVSWNTALSPQDMLIRSRHQFNSTIFREVIMVARWIIWCHQNAVIFDGALVSFRRWKEAFRDEFGLLLHRAKPSTKSLLQS
jgi:hypothetical protein